MSPAQLYRLKMCARRRHRLRHRLTIAHPPSVIPASAAGTQQLPPNRAHPPVHGEPVQPRSSHPRRARVPLRHPGVPSRDPAAPNRPGFPCHPVRFTFPGSPFPPTPRSPRFPAPAPLTSCMFRLPWIDQGHRERAGTARSLLGRGRPRKRRVVPALTLAQSPNRCQGRGASPDRARWGGAGRGRVAGTSTRRGGCRRGRSEVAGGVGE